MSFSSLSNETRAKGLRWLELMESAKSQSVEKQSRKRKRAKRRRHEKQTSNTTTTITDIEKIHHNGLQSSTTSKVPKSSTFLDKMRARLSGGHFRMINEKLYTCTGEEALNYFQEDPSLFDMYHAGYKEQMAHWPEQPINIVINWLRDHGPSLTVVDFGCGDARLAKSVKNKVFSFDLVSNDPLVIACDMSKTPLDSSSVDVAVFCLSLMGINYQRYLQEAYRVLKPCGWLLIAEVKSRFDPNTGGADPHKFSKAVGNLGFTSMLKDDTNKMFILFYFKKKEKLEPKRKEIEWPELKPCLYKRR